MGKLYAGSAKGLVAALIEGQAISAQEFEELRSFWEKGEAK